MGSLHDGHLSLVRMAKRVADHAVVSIFVNPTQFGPNEDFDAYPRDEARDAAMLVEEGASLLWAPDVATMYPGGHSTHIEVAELGADYCGAARPGHFDGVATVVAKLFNQVRPDVAIFGEKDWQQLAIIRRMARDLDFGIDILGAPIARDADGLALSSRNAYLTPDQRAAAPAFPAALNAAAQAIAGGADIAEMLAKAEAAIVAGGFDSVDYVALADADSLERLSAFRAPARLLAAARIGKTRLIDNLPVG
jgi:pantoate--beta-alanine ligase